MKDKYCTSLKYKHFKLIQFFIDFIDFSVKSWQNLNKTCHCILLAASSPRNRWTQYTNSRLTLVWFWQKKRLNLATVMSRIHFENWSFWTPTESWFFSAVCMFYIPNTLGATLYVTFSGQISLWHELHRIEKQTLFNALLFFRITYILETLLQLMHLFTGHSLCSIC